MMYTISIIVIHKMNKIIAIDTSRAFVRERTGIEEYSYQVVKHLRKSLASEQVVLYLRLSGDLRKLSDSEARDWVCAEFFDLPTNWRVRVVRWRRAWTQIGLSLAMLFDRPDMLLVLAHTVPLIHPPNTVVVVHGLEYEISPQSYSWWARVYMRASIRFSVRTACQVIAVSQNTKRDLMRLYGVSEDKITVVYEGVNIAQSAGFDFNSKIDNDRSDFDVVSSAQNCSAGKFDLETEKFFLFIGRLEERKNIAQIVRAFNEFKDRTGALDKLVLAGKQGYGFAQICEAIDGAVHSSDIIELGFISEKCKWKLLRRAHGFVFATLYEGFGLPVLEAQSVGTPVITSNISSLPEVAGGSALLVNPFSQNEIASAMEALSTMDDAQFAQIVAKGKENCQRFSWDKCAREIAQILI